MSPFGHGEFGASRKLSLITLAMAFWALGPLQSSAGIVLSKQGPTNASAIKAIAEEQLLRQKASEIEAARNLFRQGKQEACFELLERLSSTEPSLPCANTLLCWFYLAEGNLVPARAKIEDASALRPNAPYVLLTLGQLAIIEGRIAEAALILEKAKDSDFSEHWSAPKRKDYRIQVLQLLATAYFRQRRWDASDNELRLLLDLKPDDIDASQKLAFALYMKGRQTEAEAVLDEIRQRGVPLPPSELMFAQFALSTGDVKLSRSALAIAIKALPEDSTAAIWKSEFELKNGALADSRSALRLAAKRGAAPMLIDTLLIQNQLVSGEFSSARTLAWDTYSRALSEGAPKERTRKLVPLVVMALVADNFDDAWSGDWKSRQLMQAIELAEEAAVSEDADALDVAILGWCYTLSNKPDAKQLLKRSIEMSREIGGELALFIATSLAKSGAESEVAQATQMLRSLVNREDVFLLKPLAGQILLKSETTETESK